MNKETINFIWEIYIDIVAQRENQAKEDYPMYEINEIIKKLSERITLELLSKK